MHLQAYIQSSKIAKSLGTFEKYQLNKDPMLKVIGLHADAAGKD